MNLLPILVLSVLFVLPSLAQTRTVANVLRAPVKGQPAVLEGQFIGKANASTYLFQDASGRLRVDVDRKQEIGREVKKGAPIRIEGTLFRPFGANVWELRLTKLKQLGNAPDYSKAIVRNPNAVRPAVAPAVPAERSMRKPFVLPRLFGRKAPNPKP